MIDQSLLMEVMETREAIEDADGDEEELRKLMAENQEKEIECTAVLNEALNGEDKDNDAEDGSDGGGGGGAGVSHLRDARRAAVKLTYLARIHDEIKERL